MSLVMMIAPSIAWSRTMGNEAVRAGQEEEEEEAQREVGKLNAARRHRRLQILKLIVSLSLSLSLSSQYCSCCRDNSSGYQNLMIPLIHSFFVLTSADQILPANRLVHLA